MLLNLLPGLRDLRAPLAAGYLWLAAGWLYFAPYLPASANEAQGALEDVYRVVQASGPAAVGAGLTFAAYIIGMISAGMLTRPTLFIFRFPLIILLNGVGFTIGILISPFPNTSERFYGRLSKFEGWLDRTSFTAGPSPSIERFVFRRISSKLIADHEYRGVFLGRVKERLRQRLSQEESPLAAFYLYHLYAENGIRSIINNQSLSKEAKVRQIMEYLRNSSTKDMAIGFLLKQ